MLSPVCKVFWDLPGGHHALVVSADGSSYMADHLLMMLPLGVLQEHHHHIFMPPLPTTFSRALMVVEPGSANRLNLGWSMPWWGNKPFHMVIFWKNNAFPPEMDWVSNIVQVRSSDHHHSAMLEMIVTGEASLIMEKLDPETIISHLITFLRATNKKNIVPLPLFFHRSKWCENMWARGSYQSYVVPRKGGLHLQDRSLLTAELLNSKKIQPVFFGGEHTSTDHFGTVEGAFFSGVQAALLAAGQLQQERRKNSWSKSNCQMVRLMSYLDLKHPENYFRGTAPCDEADVGESFNTQLLKNERKRIENRTKNEYSQYLPQSPLKKYKLVTSHELKEHLALKRVSNPALSADEVREAHTGDASDIQVTYIDAKRNHATDGPNGQKRMQITNKKLHHEERHNSQRIPVSFDDIIEKLIKKLNEPIEDLDGFEENLAPAMRKVKQRKKHREKRKRIQKKQKYNHKHGSIRRRKNTAPLVSIPPTDKTLKHSAPPQSIFNEQKGETHLHFYMSDTKSVLNPAMALHQNPETKNNIIPDQKETIQPILPKKINWNPF